MKRTFVIIFSTLLLFLLTNKVSAQVLEKTTDRSYLVSDNYIDITETKTIRILQNGWKVNAGETEVFTVFFPNGNDPEFETKSKVTMDSIQLTDGSGATLNYTTKETDGSNLVLNVALPADVTYGSDSVIKLKYKSYGLIVKSGNIRDIFVPSFGPDYQFENSSKREIINTGIIIPRSFGEINFIAPHTPYSAQGENWQVDIPQNNLVGKNIWIQIGTTQYYQFKITQTYSRTTKLPVGFNTYKMPIPRDIDSGPISQRVYFTNISPKPDKVELDGDDNLLATFKVPANSDGEIVVEGYAILRQNKNFDPKDAGFLNDISSSLITKNTAPAPFWEVNSDQIQIVASQIKGNEKDVYNLIKNTYEHVINLIDYDETKKFGINNARQGALKTLEGGAAVCMEYSDLFIALMRAEGIPARAAFGHGYSALDYETSLNKTINHQWAEVYLPKQDTWINVDTTWGENGPSLIGGDLNHFYSHVASVSPEVPNTVEVKFIGNMDQVANQESFITTVDKVPANLEDDSDTKNDLLKKYPKKNGVNETTENIYDSIKLALTQLNNFVDDKLLLIYPNFSESALTVIKIAVISLLLVGIVSLALFRRHKKKPKINKDL